MRKTIDLMKESNAQFVFTNLVDFDSKYGHRNDAPGHARALETLHQELGVLLAVLHDDDLLLITADPGCAPTDVSTEHTREYVPPLVAAPRTNGARASSGSKRDGFQDHSRCSLATRGWRFAARLSTSCRLTLRHGACWSPRIAGFIWIGPRSSTSPWSEAPLRKRRM